MTTDPIMLQHIDEWLVKRKNDLERREFHNSLRSVGPDKPIGSFGYSRELHLIWLMTLEYCVYKLRGLTMAFISDDGNGCFRLYIYHKGTLEQLLLANHWLLDLERVPWRDHIEFIQWTRENIVPWGTPLFDLIADCYGDKLNPLRSDVLPNVPRVELLLAYQRRWKQADPTFIYYRDGKSEAVQADLDAFGQWDHIGIELGIILGEPVQGAATLSEEQVAQAIWPRHYRKIEE